MIITAFCIIGRAQSGVTNINRNSNVNINRIVDLLNVILANQNQNLDPSRQNRPDLSGGGLAEPVADYGLSVYPDDAALRHDDHHQPSFSGRILNLNENRNVNGNSIYDSIYDLLQNLNLNLPAGRK